MIYLTRMIPAGRIIAFMAALLWAAPDVSAEVIGGPGPAFEGHAQLSHFPRPLNTYDDAAAPGIAAKVLQRARQDPFNVAATAIFFLAVIHTFATGYFRRWAHEVEERHRAKMESEPHPAVRADGEDGNVSFGATMLHFLGEVEVVFGIWVIALMLAGIAFHSWIDVELYLGHDVGFAEPMFVVVIMAIAASRPVIQFAERCVSVVAGFSGGKVGAWWLTVLSLGPLLGSFITEPAAMTISALLLARKLYPLRPSAKLAYGTLGLLFVNVSIGGTLTHFAAPPILMVAAPWGWDTPLVFSTIGWKCLSAIAISNACYYAVFRKELATLDHRAHPQQGDSRLLHWPRQEAPVPTGVTLVHMTFLGWTVLTNHYPALFMGGFLFFIAFVEATRPHQTHIGLRSPILVGFFLASLVIHGRCQSWWIEPILTSDIPVWALMTGSAVLTAFNDNAAITYLAAQAPGLPDIAKYAVVAGAVAGGGLTVIANAPNPAGLAILDRFFGDGISAGKLVMGALVPTAVALGMLLVLK